MFLPIDSLGLQTVVLSAQEPEVRRRVISTPCERHYVVNLKIMSRAAFSAARGTIGTAALISGGDLVTDLLRDMTGDFFLLRFGRGRSSGFPTP